MLRLIFGGAIFSGAHVFYAQEDERRVQFQEKAKRIIPGNAGAVNATRKTNRVKAQFTTDRQRESKPASTATTRIVTVKTSNLVVLTEVSAQVLLKPSRAGAKPITKKASGQGTAEFENIAPGKYTIFSSSDGFYPTETEEIIVSPQKTLGINLELEPIKYQLNIETNASEGEVRYAPAELLGKNPDGSLKTKEKGGYCIVPIKNGKAFIKDLQKGYYNLDIRPAAIEYEPELTAVSTDILQPADDSAQSKQFYRIELDKKISTGTFQGSAWANDDWFLPSGWKLQDRTLKTDGIAGIALPRHEQYRYYQNFEMVSDVRLMDGDTVGFVLRAVDSQNYYLVQISGKNAAEPYNFSFFIVRNGRAERHSTNSIPPSLIASKKSFRVIIRGVDNVFRGFIVDSETGDLLPLGNMPDRDPVFRKGAIGIAGRANSNFEVGTFTVCTPTCQ